MQCLQYQKELLIFIEMLWFNFGMEEREKNWHGQIGHLINLPAIALLNGT